MNAHIRHEIPREIDEDTLGMNRKNVRTKCVTIFPGVYMYVDNNTGFDLICYNTPDDGMRYQAEINDYECIQLRQ